MKKGDMKRESILITAEALFFEKGYDHTSIQDILDDLKISKGGFYHYFLSKEAVLQEICENRILEKIEKAKTELSSKHLRPIHKLNAALKPVNFLETYSTREAALVLKSCYRDGDVRTCVRLRQCVRKALTPYLQAILAEGHETGEFYVRDVEHMTLLVLHMAEDVDDDACRMMCENASNADVVLDVMNYLNAGRNAIESLLNAPHGSITLFSPEKFVKAYLAAAKILDDQEE